MAHAFCQRLDLLQDPCGVRPSSSLILLGMEASHLPGSPGARCGPIFPLTSVAQTLFFPLPPLSRLRISSLAFPSAHPIPKAVLQPRSWCVGFFVLLFILLIFVCSENRGSDGAASVFTSPWKCELRLPLVAAELLGYARS